MRRLALIVRTLLAAVLLLAVALKCRAPRRSADALATYGVPARVRLPGLAAVVGVEVAAAIALLADAMWAPYLGAVLLTVFTVVSAAALLHGKAGAPCACFGASSRLGLGAVWRNAALAVAFASVPLLPTRTPSAVGWLAIALVVAFACIVALAIAVLALTREVGLLHLRLAPDAALDIAEEGPPVGSRVDVPRSADTPLTLAIFSSEGCRLCQTLAPVIESLGVGSLLDVAVFDEVRDADVWERLGIPGSPYAVALDRNGGVHAKGTFNSYGQLEGIVATAERAVAGAAPA
jgi:hypothetical protein